MFTGAVDNAYRAANTASGNKIDRGHINPSHINSFDTDYMTATYTLSNAVPQFIGSNRGPWSTFEARIANYAQVTCAGKPNGGTLYLLTGTSDYGLIPNPAGTAMVQDLPPYSFPLPHGFPGITNIAGGAYPLVTPRALWTAGCCVWQQPGAVFGYWWPSSEAESFAVMTNNQDNAALLHQTRMRVDELEVLLTTPGTSRVSLFPGYRACRNNDATGI